MASKIEIETIQAQAYNDCARKMQTEGVELTYAQADELGAALAWLETRLGLRVEETDTGVIASPREARLIYTTVREYEASDDECTGDFVGQDGEILDGDHPITVNPETREWCAGHYDGNATWEPLD